MFRDDLLDEARKMMKSSGMNQDLEDERIIQIEDIIYD
jgi:pyrimidine operon attenuation protein/uracil phosphoribosyltransferase